MRSTKKAWSALLAASALAVALPACGDDAEQKLDDAADKVQREGKEAARDVERETRDERKDAKRAVD